MKYTQVLFLLTIVLWSTACNGPAKKDAPQETEHPKLINTNGNPKYGSVQCSLQDRKGNLWFGTTEDGLYKYDGQSFSRFLVADGLNSNTISCLLEDQDGKIWIGTKAGLCRYDGTSITTIQIPLPKNQPANKNQLYANLHWVFNILQAKNGKLWFATIDGVFIYDGQSFTPFIIDQASGGYLSTNNNAEFMLEDNVGNMWFGGRGTQGVYRYDGKSITNIKLEPLTLQFESKKVSHNWAWPQLQDKNGNIWFSNWGGAYRYDGKTFTTFTRREGIPGYNGLVAKIIEDKNGHLWFGGAALSRYDGKSFTRFTTIQGLPNLGVWTILEDANGNIWVGTRETGLYQYDGKKISTYSEYKPEPPTK